jgi:hypothetical protein
MTWVGDSKNKQTGECIRRSLWRKVYKGSVYTVSCKQLRELGYEALGDTKAGSYAAANAWWHKKRAELDAAGEPPARKPEPMEDAVLSRAGVYALEESHPGLLQQISPEQLRALVERVRPVILEEMVQHGRPLSTSGLPPARVQQLQDAAKALRGELAAAPDKSVETHVGLWLQKQQKMVAAGQMTAARCANNQTCLTHFKQFLGPQSAVEAIDGPKLEAFYLYCAEKIKRHGAPGGWSVSYAKDVFAVARAFIRWAWEQGACELPRNIKIKAKFGSPLKAITTWTTDEFKKAVGAAPGKLKLALLLMANCGMTQKDVADVRDDEVDWQAGRITRRRSKTATRESAPVVSYRLWPVTLDLLRKHRSGKERVLLTKQGQPLVRTHLNAAGKRVKADAIASNYVHLKKRLGLNRPLKELRRLAAR